MPAPAERTPEATPEPADEPLTLKGSFGTAVGAAMLGLEQALRDGPPPQVRAVEHTPDQRALRGCTELFIEFPEAAEAADEHPA